MQLVPVPAELVVEGDDGVGSFRGRVLVIAVDDRGAPDASGAYAPPTWLLVADDGRPAPVWVAQRAVTAQRLGR